MSISHLFNWLKSRKISCQLPQSTVQTVEWINAICVFCLVFFWRMESKSLICDAACFNRPCVSSENLVNELGPFEVNDFNVVIIDVSHLFSKLKIGLLLAFPWRVPPFSANVNVIVPSLRWTSFYRSTMISASPVENNPTWRRWSTLIHTL